MKLWSAIRGGRTGKRSVNGNGVYNATADKAERLYACKQSTQIGGQTGYIGQFQTGVGADGQKSFTFCKYLPQGLCAGEFQRELEGILSALTNGERYGGFNDGFKFAYRADTARYSHFILLEPSKREENLSVFCYRRDWRDRHMKQAEKGIRFIFPDYREKFRIEDGDMVRIRWPDGAQFDHVCRYIDECHMEVGNNLYHICQFAELMERNSNSVIPLRSSQPVVCYGKAPEKRAIVMFERGFDGYRSAYALTKGRTSQKLIDEWNGDLGVTKAQAAAMLGGAMLGWDSPAANPKNYDEQGQSIKPRHRDRDDAR